ncbi:hypothetical protein B0T10DRAFT_266939 [Thelonectria olida]|uniref:Uncharacterized protein n=1 Tax=Thelonectria olida TaxID=1576542 RepID=A0A9P8W8G1_9HYPO|nr:hypothetical protein B0T10DRAFT_266939 [Thelonectria olida]
MHASTVLTLGSLATMASASALDNAFARREFKFPNTVPLAKRAVTGSEYQCHANCGYTILNAEEDSYCDDSEWKELLAACLECANTYDMWGDYGQGVEAAAEACGLSAVPSGSSDDSTSAAATTAAAAETTSAAAQTSAAAAETTSAAAETTAAAEETTAVEETQAEESSAVEETQAEETEAGETAVPTSIIVSTTIASTPTGSNGTSSTPTSTVIQAGAPVFAISHVLAAGAALVAVAGLM